MKHFKLMKKLVLLALGLLLLAVTGLGIYGYWGLDQHVVSGTGFDGSVNAGNRASPESEVARGAYLVKQANCMACHTSSGGQAYAGGRLLRSAYGDFYAPNITPDKVNGIGTWTADDFWNALHNGKGKGGRLLYPAFPFENYTHITRADANAMWRYLQTLPSVAQANQEHRLDFPYNQRWTLAWWRALYFQVGELPYQAQQTASWNRGAYLVRGLGHCSACHATRNGFGGSSGSADLSGATMFASLWYAPSLFDASDSHVASFSGDELAQLLQQGQNHYRALLGPMAEVVKTSLQSWRDEDVAAMTEYLQTEARRSSPKAVKEADFLDRSLQRASVTQEELEVLMVRGEKIYRQHCAECHLENGKGRNGIYPKLAGNASVQRDSSSNLIRAILAGGFAPSTEKHPRPFGMPPFSYVLDDSEVALVATYVRNRWGNKAGVVTPSEVNVYRTVSLD